MDLFEELEMMALNASEEREDGEQYAPSDVDITRWQQLFNHPAPEAAILIEERRKDFSRKRVSDEHWEIIQRDMEAQGYDRKAYEDSLEVYGKRAMINPPVEGENAKIPQAGMRASYIFRLEGPLDTLEKIQSAANLSEPPEAMKATGDDGDAIFCRINGEAKQAIADWLSAQNIKFKTTFTRISKAEKALSTYSSYPTLGLDTTLPQNRPDDNVTNFYPAQHQYPVWYFFYGTLANRTILSAQLCLPEDQLAALEPASISGGILTTWAGRYQALIDGPASSSVKGSAYEVTSKEHEDALRHYETNNYEVVRCQISMKDRDVQGCTFRFVGS
jgi:hypothetical protein